MKQKKSLNSEHTTKKPFHPRKSTPKSRNKAVQSTVHEVLLQEEPHTPVVHSPAETLESAPAYELPVSAEKIKPLNFSRLIPNDDILAALEKSSYHVPSDMLLTVLPAVLRGSDTLIYQSKQPDDFLIGVIPAISKMVYAEDSEKSENHPTALFLFGSEESAQAASALAADVFQDFKINFVFTSPKSLLEAHKNNQLKLNHVKLLCIHELHLFEGEDRDMLNRVMDIVPNEKIQKIFISYQNTPKIREFAFKYLEDPEIFSFLPSEITEQYPRQFAHALEATQKFQVLLGYLKTYKPRAALVVANTRTVAEWIAFKLNGNGIKVSLLVYPVSPYQNRVNLLNSIANGDINVFVTTDYAIKNFGTENINCVYHFDLPDNPLLYLERLNKIEGARNPISIAFICEDYGFNMGKIEETLGFKIRLTTPDKNFFNFKDTSEYPLESSGRVKTLLQGNEEPKQVRPEAQVRPDARVDVPRETRSEARSEARNDVLRETRSEVRSDVQKETRSEARPNTRQQHTPAKSRHSESRHSESRHSESKLQAAPLPQEDTLTSQTEAVTQPQRRPASRHHQPDTSKFVRRDERAREAVADAVLAAKMAEEKRKAQDSQKPKYHDANSHTQTTQKQENVLSALFSVVSEAVRAGVHATKESLSRNSEQKLPALHRFLNKKNKK